MKKTLIKFAALAALITLAFTACSKPTDNNSSKKNQNTSVDDEITGDLTTAETWAGKDANGGSITYYINSNYTIKDSGSLTIEKGAIVKFGPNGKITVNRTSITATGVIFTSYKDERGRTISAAGGSAPAPGDWKQIDIYGGTGTFTECEFSYGGNECSTLEIVKNSTKGKARIDRCTFKNNSGTKSIPDNDSGVKAALKFDKTCEYDASINSVTNSTFENNVWPLSMPADFYIVSNNTFNDNEYNYVYINDSDISGTTTWEHLNIPYIFVDNNNLTIKANGSLTINGGNEQSSTTVCFTNGGIYINKDGTLTVSSFVKFTNCDKNPTILFKGIQCVTSRTWSTGTNSHDTTSLVYLKSSGNVVIEKDEVPASYKNEPNKYLEILPTNNYEAFKFDNTN